MMHWGDCRESLRRLAAEGARAQTCVTSPPYFGLRSYGVEGQFGLESTPDEYVARMVEVFRCVHDVLADDGTLWLNLGDSYASSPPGNKTQGVSAKSGLHGVNGTTGAYRATLEAGHATKRDTSKIPGIKPKELIGIPWRVAFALQADGWWLRQDIIWHKPAPMPESVRDRCTKAHEYVFLLSKSKRYLWDAEAMQEPCVSSAKDLARAKVTGRGNQAASAAYLGSPQRDKSGGFPTRGGSNTRNRRSVWTIATRPYKGAHFATFPSALIEPCILAGSRPGDTVLDPFMGSGTTAAVAEAHGRRWIGCELNRAYEPLIMDRLYPGNLW